jgi:hypothetical protein
VSLTGLTSAVGLPVDINLIENSPLSEVLLAIAILITVQCPEAGVVLVPVLAATGKMTALHALMSVHLFAVTRHDTEPVPATHILFLTLANPD